MPTRRTLLASAAAFAALPALAQQRDNPMPEEMRRALEREPTAPVLGNPDGNITLTEFFDYNCPHCKTMLPLMSELVRSDPQLRVVLREWPVFGPGSEFAARASLATIPARPGTSTARATAAAASRPVASLARPAAGGG